MGPEAKLKKKCLDYLRQCGAKVLVTTGVSEAGTPDLLACLRGRCLAIELKAPGKRPTPLQIKRLAEWEAADAIVAVIDSLEGLADFLNKSHLFF